MMKRIISVVLLLCMLLPALPTMAADQPFEDGVYYGQQWRDNGAKPSMLNFGKAMLSPGESLYDAKTQTVKQDSAKSIMRNIDNGMTYYIYAKWQCAYAFDYYFIDAMLVMTDPDGNYYATYGDWEIFDGKRRMLYSWFFDVTDMLERCREDHNGELPKGQYSFSMFFNNQSFRVTKVRLN